MRLEFLGAARRVTGSCFSLEACGVKMLVECGMNQGHHSDESNREDFAFDPSEIEYVFLTHAHIDHSGLLPLLVKRGFKGRIICTPATADLTLIMLRDSAHIQEKDAEWLTKKGLRAGRETSVMPLYSIAEAERIRDFLHPVPYNKKEKLCRGIKYRFLDAGHILGSSSLEIWHTEDNRESKMVFSGDIGKVNSPIVRDPTPPKEADFLIIESTYGNRLHRNMDDTIDEFTEVINATFKRGGNVLIPSFAVGRTQDLLYTLNMLTNEDRIKRPMVFVDSPLAEEATQVYLRHTDCFDEEALRALKEYNSREFKVAFTKGIDESQRINHIRSGAMIIAGSGMCDGGRIKHHFKHNLWRKECSVIFAGFQARGTLGRRIVDGVKRLNILGEEIAIKASVHTIGGFSAHADRDGLIQWLGALRNKPKVFVTHGEEETALGFAELIKERLVMDVSVPEKGDVYTY